MPKKEADVESEELVTPIKQKKLFLPPPIVFGKPPTQSFLKKRNAKNNQKGGPVTKQRHASPVNKSLSFEEILNQPQMTITLRSHPKGSNGFNNVTINAKDFSSSPARPPSKMGTVPAFCLKSEYDQ